MIYIYVIYNIAVFLIFGFDKLCAVRDKWRVSEKALLLLSLFMGAAGGILGMFTFSHKTRKLKFRILMPLLLMLNIICICLILKYKY